MKGERVIRFQTQTLRNVAHLVVFDYDFGVCCCVQSSGFFRLKCSCHPAFLGSLACGAPYRYRAASSTSHVDRLTSPLRLPDSDEAGTSESEPSARQAFRRPPGELSVSHCRSIRKRYSAGYPSRLP